MDDFWRIRNDGIWFTSCSGVQIAHPDKLVIDIAGSIGVDANENITAVQYKLPITIFILNNRCGNGQAVARTLHEKITLKVILRLYQILLN